MLSGIYRLHTIIKNASFLEKALNFFRASHIFNPLFVLCSSLCRGKYTNGASYNVKTNLKDKPKGQQTRKDIKNQMINDCQTCQTCQTLFDPTRKDVKHQMTQPERMSNIK